VIVALVGFNFDVGTTFSPDRIGSPLLSLPAHGTGTGSIGDLNRLLEVFLSRVCRSGIDGFLDKLGP